MCTPKENKRYISLDYVEYFLVPSRPDVDLRNPDVSSIIYQYQMVVVIWSRWLSVYNLDSFWDSNKKGELFYD